MNEPKNIEVTLNVANLLKALPFLTEDQILDGLMRLRAAGIVRSEDPRDESR
jgi:hypothetical protein